mgnify:FL=1
MDGRHLDLQLLAIFDAVLLEGNVTRAAARIGISQSSASKGLSQLRQIVGDPLFLRSGRGVTPTHKAIEIADKVRLVLGSLGSLTSPGNSFDPATSRIRFNIGATDYVSFVLLPVLARRLAKIAPFVSLEVHPIEPAVPEELLLLGKADIVLSSVRSVSHPIYRQELFRDGYVCLWRRGHPYGTGPITVEQFASARHLAMPRQNGARERVLQDVMQGLGIARDVALQVPQMLAIPATLSETDLIATVARRTALAFADTYALQISAHPLPLGRFSVSQLWHARTQSSQSQRWLRDVIASVAQTL